MVTEFDLDLPDGRRLHAYDTGEQDRLAVVWHHGTPNIGAPPAPLFADADRLGLRWVGYDRPGYGGSTPREGRNVASAAEDVQAVVDALGIDRFALLGHSGGGPHALACAALIPDRVVAVASGAALAPYGAEGLDYFSGMAPLQHGAMRATVTSREAIEAYEEQHANDSDIPFTKADWAALEGEWGWFGSVVGPAVAAGPAAGIDDNRAFVAPWGFDLARIEVPTYIFHGRDDVFVPCAHGEWLAEHIPGAELTILDGEGHVSVLKIGPDILAWLRDRFHG
jgi:pimeloyl-ACP methyl ester carboxylesterase